MSWVKLSDDFADDCARHGLSDAAVRTHMEGLLWTMRRETGGDVLAREVRRFAETPNPAAAIAELVTVGFWEKTEGGYLIVHHMEHQPEPDVIAQRRANAAERQRRWRRKLAGLDE
jgi:hypothetical protein